MRVSVEDYSPFLSELSMFRVYLHATVDETDQLTATFSDFRLILPKLDIIVSIFYLFICLLIYYPQIEQLLCFTHKQRAEYQLVVFRPHPASS